MTTAERYENAVRATSLQYERWLFYTAATPAMNAPCFDIKPSPIDGLGLFASARICAGETTLDWSHCSEALTPEQVSRLPENELRYISVIDGQHVRFLAPARYVNHSCAPNAKATNGRDVATRDIEVGEEITVDYRAEQVPGLNFECRCRESTCRGQLNTAAL